MRSSSGSGRREALLLAAFGGWRRLPPCRLDPEFFCTSERSAAPLEASPPPQGHCFFLARPWLHLYEENLQPVAPPWLSARQVGPCAVCVGPSLLQCIDSCEQRVASGSQAEFARQLFGLRVFAHPVLVAQTIHRLPLRSFPQVNSTRSRRGLGRQATFFDAIVEASFSAQVAIVGHSNAGKSSLVNGLFFGREVARTSKTPVSESAS